MNPRDDLLAGPDGPSKPETEDREQSIEDASFAAEHDTRANGRDAQPQRLGAPGGGLPPSRQVCEEASAGRALFGEHLVLAIPVVADGAARDHDVRPTARGSQRADEPLGEIDGGS